jgi:hypothetical protein
MTESECRIKYRKGDFEVEIEGDKSWVEAEFRELTEFEPTKPPTAASPVTSIPLPQESLADFMKSMESPTKHNAIVVLFGYWLFHKGGQNSFNLKDIEKCCDETRMVESSNTSQYMNDAEDQGYFKRLDEKKDNLTAWTITTDGDKFVDKRSWKTVE